MIDTNKSQARSNNQKGGESDLTKNMIFQIIQSSANDNIMPTMKWFTWLIAWTILVGGVLAYAIF